MAYVQYKYVAEHGNLNGVDELIIDIINREAKNDEWGLHSFDFASGLGRAILVKVFTDDEEACCANGECTCR